jgi:uncharacterized protein (TIGR00369 family)
MVDRQYGAVAAEDLASLTGLELLERMVAGEIPAPPISRTMGFRLAEVEPGRAVFEGEPGEALINPLGSVHGGWALTLIDSATGCALHTELPAGIGYTTVETKANFTRAIAPGSGTVRCEGRVVSRGRQIATAEARLTASDGRLLAHGTSTLIILPPRG